MPAELIAPSNRKNIVFLAVLFVLLAIIETQLIPRAYANGTIYIIPLVLSIYFIDSRSQLGFLLTLCLGTTGWGFISALQSNVDFNELIISHIFTLLVITVAGWLGFKEIELKQRLRNVHNRLEISIQSANLKPLEFHIPNSEDKTIEGIINKEFIFRPPSSTIPTGTLFVPAADLKSLKEGLSAILTEKKLNYNAEYRLCLPGGQIFWIGVRGRMEYALGSTKFTGVGWDASETRRAQLERDVAFLELQRSNADLEQFAYIASHDLQTPLRHIASFTQSLEKRVDVSQDKSAQEDFYYIKSAVGRMRNLIDDLLSYSRVGKNRSKDEKINLEATVNEIRSMVNAPSSTIDFRGPIQTIKGDQAMIFRCLQNLIFNAIKFSKDEGNASVQVNCEEDDKNWILSVKDNGIGISEEYHQKVFEIFKRLHGRETYEGTGIGLAVCKKVAELHGGSIHVESKLNEGASFILTLPKHLTHNRLTETEEIL